MHRRKRNTTSKQTRHAKITERHDDARQMNQVHTTQHPPEYERRSAAPLCPHTATATVALKPRPGGSVQVTVLPRRVEAKDE